MNNSVAFGWGGGEEAEAKDVKEEIPDERALFAFAIRHKRRRRREWISFCDISAHWNIKQAAEPFSYLIPSVMCNSRLESSAQHSRERHEAGEIVINMKMHKSGARERASECFWCCQSRRIMNRNGRRLRQKAGKLRAAEILREVQVRGNLQRRLSDVSDGRRVSVLWFSEAGKLSL